MTAIDYGPLTDPTFEDIFQGIFGEAFDLLVERQRKYGPENIERLGPFGVFSRLAHDKVERVSRSFRGEIAYGKVLLGKPSEFDDESYEDALLDIANYALIMIAQHRNLWGAPLSDT
jgi:hypothetical protein